MGDGTTLECWDAYTDSEEDPTKNDTLDNINDITNRLSSQKLSEDSDRQLMNDLFFGSDNHVEDDLSNTLFPNNSVKKIVLADPYSQIELKCLKDCETVAKKLSQKIDASHAKSGVWLQFLDILLQSCEKKLELKDVQTLKKKVENIIKTKEGLQREKAFSKKKPNDYTSSKNYKDELDILYGDLSDEDEDEPFYYQ